METRIATTAAGRRELTNALRFLAIDAVEAANSGHPGMPMGMAEIAEVLWRRHLKHNPADPICPDRDRFVLSNGHGSMLLYALLHLTGYALPIEELKRFRQLHSKTPGHPEVGITPGVETTTGPLGQGLANAVGMALSEQLLAAEFNRPGHTIVDHRTWVFVGDGCLMEGISHEACSLAGTLGLSKLIAVYDDNGISIDGQVEHWFADDTPRRFEAYGWRVIRDVDGHDTTALELALQHASEDSGRPTLVCCKTIIGKGSPNKAGSHDVHGAALGAAEVAATRAALGWTAAPFQITAGIRAAWDARAASEPALASVIEKRAGIASRKASQDAIEALLPLLPELLGGSADLTGSNLTAGKASVPLRHGQWGNHINYGVREFGMSAIMNGIALHGGYIPYGGTFLTFSDYSRNAVRMAALMGERGAQQLRDIRKGGYLLAESQGPPALTLLATGSEVALAMRARDALAAQGIGARVVSMPSCSDFDAQDAQYRSQVLPRSVPVLAIEAGVTKFWRAYVGFDGDVVGIDCFGESAPAGQVAEALGMTVAAIVERARTLARGGGPP